jgi:hypothetical protein
MLKSVEGIYDRGEIKLQEKPDDIPQKTKVIVTFLTPDRSDSDLATEGVLSNEKIDKTLQIYRQENKFRPSGLCKGEFVVPDDFNEPLPDEILALFEGQ